MTFLLIILFSLNAYPQNYVINKITLNYEQHLVDNTFNIKSVVISPGNIFNNCTYDTSHYVLFDTSQHPFRYDDTSNIPSNDLSFLNATIKSNLNFADDSLMDLCSCTEYKRHKLLIETSKGNFYAEWDYFEQGICTVCSLENIARAIDSTSSIYISYPSSIHSRQSSGEYAPIKFNVYPSPCSGSSTIFFKHMPNDQLNINIMDLYGKSLCRFKNLRGNNFVFDSRYFKNGLYIIELILSNTSITKYIILVNNQ